MFMTQFIFFWQDSHNIFLPYKALMIKWLLEAILKATLKTLLKAMLEQMLWGTLGMLEGPKVGDKPNGNNEEEAKGPQGLLRNPAEGPLQWYFPFG